MENISKSIWQKIWETLKLIWQKTLIFTVIGFFTALFLVMLMKSGSVLLLVFQRY